MNKLGLWIILGLLSAATPAWGQGSMPVTTDSRIKTFVYNENDVFSVLTHYGYQSNVEFGKFEEVMTISVGDRVAWQIVPAGRRLFIKALEENAHTNMTVVTNKRAYQFDLRSSGSTPLHPSEELVYVVRFFYPDEQPQQPTPPLYSDQPAAAMPPAAMPMNMPAPSIPVAAQGLPPLAPLGSGVMPGGQGNYSGINNGNYNYNYTYTGPEAIAPVKIYDDGRSTTYFKFNQLQSTPQFYIMAADGTQQPVPYSVAADGALAVQAIVPRIAVRQAEQTLIVYNENLDAKM